MPLGLKRATATSEGTPDTSVTPATTILPSACRAAPLTWSAAPKSALAAPSPLKLASDEPSGLSRVTTKLSVSVLPDLPAITIFPSGCTRTVAALSPARKSIVLIPSPSKLESRSPGAAMAAVVPSARVRRATAVILALRRGRLVRCLCIVASLARAVVCR